MAECHSLTITAELRERSRAAMRDLFANRYPAAEILENDTVVDLPTARDDADPQADAA